MTTKYSSSSCGVEPPGAVGLHVCCGCVAGELGDETAPAPETREMRVPDPDTGLHAAALWLCFDLKVTVLWCFPLGV